MLVLFPKLCLNNNVQKHTRIKAKGGRLSAVQPINSLLRKIAEAVDLTIIRIR